MFADGSILKFQSLTSLEPSQSQLDQLAQNPSLDIMKEKIYPHVVHLNKNNLKSITEYLTFNRMVSGYPDDRKIGFIIDDGKFESMKTAVVDMAFGLGFEYLNVQGFFKGEKLAKIIRFSEIIEDL